MRKSTYKRRPARRPQRAKKTPYRRRRYARATKPYMKIMRQPVPDKMFTKLNYSEVLTMNLAASMVLVGYQFRTSIFDPDLTGVGHQPMWYDQMNAFYKRYRVHGIKYKFTIVNTNTNQLCTGAVKHSSDGVLETNLNTLRERRSARKWIGGPSTVRPTVCKGFMYTGKPHGLSKKDFLADEDFEAAYGSNPVKQSWLEFYATTLNTSAVLNIQCDLVYYVELLDRVSIAGS